MRISDWSSDVCSSDRITFNLNKQQQMSTYHRWPVVSMSILCFLSVSQCMNVLAQTADTLDRVVVTAGHLETKRSEAPIAITQLDSDQLADPRAATMDKVLTKARDPKHALYGK